MARRRRGPEGSILDGCDPRTGAGNEASRDGSAARANELPIRGPLGRATSHCRRRAVLDGSTRGLVEVDGLDAGTDRWGGVARLHGVTDRGYSQGDRVTEKGVTEVTPSAARHRRSE